MRRAVPLALCLLAITASPAAAQRSEPLPVGIGSALGEGAEAAIDLDPNEELLRALAGPQATVHHDASRFDGVGRVSVVSRARFRGTGTPLERTVALVHRFRGVLGLPPDGGFVLESERDLHGLHVVRLAMTFEGLPVMGTVVVSRFLPDGSMDHLAVAEVPRALAFGERRLRTSRDAETAVSALLGQSIRALSSTAVWLPMFHELVPAWRVEVVGAIETEREALLLDARTGAPLLRMPRLAHAMGTVFPHNPVTDDDVTTDVELTDLTGSGLSGRYARTISCNAMGRGCSPTAYATPDGSGDFLFAPDEGAFDDPFAEVNAYHHVNVAARYFRERHGFTWSCGASTSMEVLVNYSQAAGVAYDNAAYSPGGGGDCGFLLFGQGASGDFAWDADVVYHEYGHAVTDALTAIFGFRDDNLGISYEPLAINEGASDYWAGTIQGDGAIAESFSEGPLGGGHGSLRVIDNELRCPEDLIGEGHFDGRLFAGMVWDTRVAAGDEAADAILYAAMGTYLSNVSLAEAASGFHDAAQSLVDAGTLPATALTAVDAAIAGHTLTDCRRIVPLDGMATRTGYSGSDSFTPALGRSIAPNHYRIEVPVDATAVRIQVTPLTVAGEFTLHFRAGTPIRVSSSVTSSFQQALGRGGIATIDASSALPLPRCQTLYVAVQVDDLRTAGQSLYTVQAFVDRSGDPSASCPELPPDAGPTVADAGVDAGPMVTSPGCGCRAAARADGLSWMGALLAGLVLWRRRR